MLQLHAADRIEDRAHAGQHFRQLFDRHVCAGIALRQAEASQENLFLATLPNFLFDLIKAGLTDPVIVRLSVHVSIDGY